MMDLKWEDIDAAVVTTTGKSILEWITGGFGRFFKSKTTIAITGMQGVGKSVLLDFLTGEAHKPGYKPPLQSQAVETGTIDAGKKRLLVSVIPGQAGAYPRMEALDELFKSDEPVDGVIHVVANGYATIRSPDAEKTLVKELGLDTIPKLREYQKKRELADLGETCEAIRASHRKHHTPRWMIVAVDKVDLYFKSLAKVREYYAPTGDSEFTQRLKQLSTQVGNDHFRWEIAPICTNLQTFEWSKQNQPPLVQEAQRNAYVAQFLWLLESYHG